MKYYQIKINLDQSFCADYYSDTIFSSETSKEIREATEFASTMTTFPFRKHPFSIVRCEHCGQWIISNRDVYERFKCQNCKQETSMKTIEGEEFSALLDQIHNAFGYNIEPCESLYCYMACLLPNGADREQFLHVLKIFGFEQTEQTGSQFTKIMLMLIVQEWYSPSKTIIYAVTPLTNHDCLFEGVIPRVESCDRAIRRIASPVYTVSAHAAEAPNRDRKHFVKRYIEDLIAEGKLDEAQELLSKL